MGTLYTLKQPLEPGAVYDFPAFVGSQADTDVFQTTVTLAAGDVKLSKDGAAFANLTSLPTETGTSGCLVVSLTAAETTGITKYAVVLFHDALGDEWQDVAYVIPAMEAISAVSAASASYNATDLPDIVRYVTYSETITGLTIDAGWTSMELSVKESPDDTDANALLNIVESNPGVGTDGLIYIQKQTTAAALLAVTDASLTVNQGAGTVAVYIKYAATTELEDFISASYDLIQSDGTDKTRLTWGKVNIVPTETRA